MWFLKSSELSYCISNLYFSFANCLVFIPLSHLSYIQVKSRNEDQPLTHCSNIIFIIGICCTELEENPDSPPYLISHGEKIGGISVLPVTHSESVDRVWAIASSTHANGSNIDAQFLHHSWWWPWRHYLWLYRESGFSSNSVIFLSNGISPTMHQNLNCKRVIHSFVFFQYFYK